MFGHCAHEWRRQESQWPNADYNGHSVQPSSPQPKESHTAAPTSNNSHRHYRVPYKLGFSGMHIHTVQFPYLLLPVKLGLVLIATALGGESYCTLFIKDHQSISQWHRSVTLTARRYRPPTLGVRGKAAHLSLHGLTTKTGNFRRSSFLWSLPKSVKWFTE